MNITRYCHIRNFSIAVDGDPVFRTPPGSLDDFLASAYDHLQPAYPKFYKMDRLSKAGFLAAEVLLQGRLEGYTPDEINLVLSNASSSLDTDLRFHETIPLGASPALFVYTLPNIVAGEICIRHKIKGEYSFFVSPEFDPGTTAAYCQSLVEAHGSGKKTAVIGGWIEVLRERHDVFLYLAENSSEGLAEPSASVLTRLYNLDYGTTDSQS